MANNDWFDDFMEFKLSGSGNGDDPVDLGGCLPWVVGVLVMLWILSKLFC